MDIKEITSERLNEKLYLYEHPSGLKAYVMPKPGYTKKYATFATHYGSINNEFIIPGEQAATRMPDGVAHFLEHKLFEQKDGSVMDKFSKLGSNPNAYTGFNATVYLFSCTDRFEENFQLLLDFVQNPYITGESVEKEKGIIGQEIRMYEDDPGWRVFFNYLAALYINHPVKIDIAGSVESISKINRDSLYKCYNTFYHPSNMVIFIVGDVDVNGTLEIVEKAIKTSEKKGEIKRIFPDEPQTINKPVVEQKLVVAQPLFQMGFKDPKAGLKGQEAQMRELAVRMLQEIIMGRSSDLYRELYEEGLINDTFEMDYMLEDNYGLSAFGGESRDPIKVRDRFFKEIAGLQKRQLDEKIFRRVKKSTLGKFLRQFNSVERISHGFIANYFKSINIFDYFHMYDKITLEVLNSTFGEHFNTDRMAISIVNPA